MVKGQELKIVFIGDFAFLTKEVALNFSQVQISDQPIRFKYEAYWSVRVISYIPNEKRLHVEVLKYHLGSTDFSFEQLQLEDQLNEVEIVTFKSIDTTGLLQTLHGTIPQTFSPSKPETVYRNESPTQTTYTPFERKPVVQVYQEPFLIAIKDVTFHNGYISFEKKLPGFKKPLAFQIPNVHLMKQYDAIKNYFAIVLKTKKIKIVPDIILTDGDIISFNATSAEIDRIDPTLIENVKFELVKPIRRKDLLEDQHLYDVDEYIDTLTDEDDMAVIFSGDNDFMNVILERSDTKHYHQLRYLSSKQQADLQKLRIIKYPFSFVFFLAGAQQFHIVWETIDAKDATYIWSTKKENDLKAVYDFIKQTHAIIQQILMEGRNKYLSRHEDNFTKILHDYINLHQGFRNWKKEIDMVIHK